MKKNCSYRVGVGVAAAAVVYLGYKLKFVVMREKKKNFAIIPSLE